MEIGDGNWSQKPLKLSAFNLQYPKRSGVHSLPKGLQIFKKAFLKEIKPMQISTNVSLILSQYGNIIVAGELIISLLGPISYTKNYF